MVKVNRTFATDGYVRISLLSYGAEKAAVQHNLKGPAPTPTPAPVPRIENVAHAVATPTPHPVIPALSPVVPVAAPVKAATVVPATPAPTATPKPIAMPAPAKTYAETAGGIANTWTNYLNAGGTAGPRIAGGQTVQIACKVSGFRVADGNTWWYRIASSPWNGAYYVSADAFYNNGLTAGSLAGTPWVDPLVPSC